MLIVALLGATETLIKPDPAFVTLLTTAVIPLLVGLITKKYASKAVKALTNAAVVAIVATLTLAATNGLTLQALLLSVFVGFLTSSAAHEFIWKNLGVSVIVANAAPDFGIGRANPIDLGPGTAAMFDIQEAMRLGLGPDEVETPHTIDSNAEHGVNPELRGPDEEV